MTGQPQLFDATAEVRLTPAQRLVQRQTDMIRHGFHPLGDPGSALRIHPGVRLDEVARDNAPSRPLRCGRCVFRELVGGHARDFPKCMFRPPDWPADRRPPRMSNGARTDCRSWMPACTDFKPRPR